MMGDGDPAVDGASLDAAQRNVARRPDERIATFAEALPALVFVTDCTGRNVYTNERFQAYAGVAAEALLGDGWLRVLHPDDRARAEAAWRQAVGTATPYEAEYRFRRHDGAYRWFLVRALPEAGSGAALDWYGTAFDVDDQRHAAADLARAKRELESRIDDRSRALDEAARQLAAEMRRREEAQAALLQTQKLDALGQLTSGVAHDFNNVLAGIAGSVELLERSALDDAQRRYLQFARRGVDRAKRLVRQLVAFSRAESLSPRPLDVRALLEQAGELLAQAVGPTVRLELDVPPGVVVAADPHQLEVALLNLAFNARDAMPEGGTLTLSAGRLAPGTRPPGVPGTIPLVVVRVRDTGVGMAPEVAARASEPFFTTKPAGAGTGLGLAMVSAFARDSGGGFALTSRLGAGTEACLYLPASDLAPGALAGDAPIDRARHGRATLLVVDDDEVVRQTTAGILRDLGYSVLEAGDPLTAYALARATASLDAIVSDVVMPTMDGPALLARLRAERATPVLFVTGHAQRARLFGEHVLEKPFTPAELATHVLRVLGRDESSPARGSRAEAELTVRRIRRRLSGPAAIECLDSWLAHWRPGHLPDVAALDRGDCRAQSFVARPDEDGGRYVELGEDVRGALEALAEAPLDAAPDVPTEVQAAAYRRCLDSRLPTFERVQQKSRDGVQVRFERLLLPASAGDGRPTHVVGIVVQAVLA
jgi:PAS domain S-box-containing protein